MLYAVIKTLLILSENNSSECKCSQNLLKLTVHKNIKAGDDGLRVVVVAALALQLCVKVCSTQMFQLHCVS